jgi:glycosyltransferase involved in cell wall biosynthesis
VTRVLVFSPTLGDGGSDRVTLTLLRGFAGGRIVPSLVLMRREGALVERIPRLVPLHVLGTRRLAVSVPALARIIRSERPDVVLCMHGGANVIVAAAHLAARSRARLVLSERSALVRDDRTRLRTVVETAAKRALYRRADLVTAVSDGVARDLVDRLGLPADRVAVVYNPVLEDDLAAQAAAPVEHSWFAAGRGGEVPVIVAAGRLVAIKDYPTLLAAFARVRAARPVRLAILGDGPLRDQLAERIAADGLAADVALLGYQANPFQFMARARLLLHASRAEGLPGALIQAMACGAPVVSTDCDFGPREVVTDGRDGFLVPVGDAAALADRVGALLDDAALASRMGEAARASAARFAARAVIERYERAITGDA